ncbi:MAG: hypothetical protein ACI9VR_000151 [Cognaticolwellia sp.]|jgi:hypothetical protein
MMTALLLSLVACTSANDAGPDVSIQARLFNAALERADGRAIVVTDLEMAEEFIQDALAQEPSDYSQSSCGPGDAKAWQTEAFTWS